MGWGEIIVGRDERLVESSGGNIVYLFNYYYFNYLFYNYFYLFIFSFIFGLLQGCVNLKQRYRVAWVFEEILSEWPTIVGSIQEYAIAMMGPIISVYFSYGTILIGHLGCVPDTLHRAHTCVYGLTSQFV